MEQDTDIMDTFGQRLGDKLKPNNYYGFDPTIIVSILAAIVQALQGVCKPTPAQLKRGGILVQARTLAMVNHHFPSMTYRQRCDMTGNIVDVGKEANDKEREAFLAQF